MTDRFDEMAQELASHVRHPESLKPESSETFIATALRAQHKAGQEAMRAERNELQALLALVVGGGRIDAAVARRIDKALEGTP